MAENVEVRVFIDGGHFRVRAGSAWPIDACEPCLRAGLQLDGECGLVPGRDGCQLDGDKAHVDE